MPDRLRVSGLASTTTPTSAPQSPPASTTAPVAGSAEGGVEEGSPRKMFRDSLVWLIVYVLVLVLVLAVIKLVFAEVSKAPFLHGALGYEAYADVPVSIALGALIAFKLSDVIYWNLRLKLAHAEAASVRSVFRIIGIVAVIVTTVSAYVSATAAAGLGAFAGLVVGFATQQVLGQAVAGVFLSVSRPFKAGDNVNVQGQQGKVVDVSALFTVLDTGQETVLIPNSSVIANIIKRSKPAPPQGQEAKP
ncbi:MAG: mechanosensitive ion channel family protein [Thermoprotei archaeon]